MTLLAAAALGFLAGLVLGVMVTKGAPKTDDMTISEESLNHILYGGRR